MDKSKFRWIGKSTDGKTVTLNQLEESMFKLNTPETFDPESIKTGMVLDVETSGLSQERDQIIEIGLRLFHFDRNTGQIVKLGDSYSSFQDPGFPLSNEITAITGITDEMVKGKQIDWKIVDEYFQQSQIIIAHNASFDRPFIDRHSTISQQKIWGCSFKQIDWNSKGFPSQKLEILSIYHGFFTDSHRALNDSDALLYLLSFPDQESSKPYFFELIQNARRSTAKVMAIGSAFETKDILRARQYRWDALNKYWYKQVFKDELEAEIAWLETDIYRGPFRGKYEEIPVTENFKS